MDIITLSFDEKRKLREHKRRLKRAGNKKIRAEVKRQLDVDGDVTDEPSYEWESSANVHVDKHTE